MKFIKFFILFLTASSAALADSAPKFSASINPIYQILLEITQDKENSFLLSNPSALEHSHQLKQKEILALKNSNLVFLVDEELEKNLAKFLRNSDHKKNFYQLSKIDGIKLLKRRDQLSKNDLHIWLNPDNAIKIAEFMTQKISEIDPTNAPKYRKNFSAFKEKISLASKIIAERLRKLSNTNYVFYHDGFQYFEDYFSLKPLMVVTYESDAELTVKQLRAFDKLAKQQQIKCIFGDPQDEKNSALKLAKNYKIKFSILDLIGLKDDYGKKSSGFEALLFNIESDLTSCLNDAGRSHNFGTF